MDTERKRGLRQYLILVAKGFCMGAADVVPGVSGGTMALILGIYEELVRAIRSIDLAFARRIGQGRFGEAFAGVPWPFLLFLGGGILTAVITLARAIGWALERHPAFVWSFFFGLVLASIWTVGRQAPRWTWAMTAWAAAGAAAAYWVVGMVPMRTPEAPWFLFLSGAVAICAMILPGISGSFILVLLGKYQYVLEAVNRRDLVVILIFGAGAACGLLCFVRLLSWLLDRYRDWTLAALAGLMLGSLRKIWPWKDVIGGQAQANVLPAGWSADVVWAIGLMAFGMLTVFVLDALAKDRHHGAPR